MNGKTILTGIAAFATTMAFGMTTQAAVFVWTQADGGNTLWSDQDNWYNKSTSSVNGVPGNGDVAIFDRLDAHPSPNPSSVTLGGAVTVGHIDVLNATPVSISASSAQTLNLTAAGGADGVLIIDDNFPSSMSLGAYTALAFNSARTHEIGGVLVMTSQTNDASIRVNADVTFGPYSSTYGSVRGEDAGAKILIADGMELVNQITCEGKMEIAPQPAGTATFTNFKAADVTASGRVLANSTGVLKLAADLILDDGSANLGSYRPSWRVSASSAELEFNEPASLDGNFSDVGCLATLRFNAAVSTNGSLSTHTGRIWAVSFQFQASNYDSTGVSQPDTACP